MSAAADGWRVRWPEAVLETLARAGAGAKLTAATAVDWPDACLRAPA